MKLIIALIILCSCKLISNDVWIYSDDGTWEDGIKAFEQFLDFYEIKHKRIFADDLNNSNNYSEALAICFPGGYAYNYKVALTAKSINNIRNYVASGGAYIGICAGAFFASSEVVWESGEYPYSLSLFEGKATGSIYEIAVWDNYAMTTININQENNILQNEQDNLTVLYYGGPYFESDKTNFDIIATWDEYNDYPSIINFKYENGKVLLIGPHLEIEENNSRDSTQFAEELNDVESDWGFLSSIMNWVLENETSVTNETIYNDFKIYPSPANSTISLSDGELGTNYKIINQFGEEVMNGIYNGNIDISNLTNGTYFIIIHEENTVITEKFIKIN